MTEIMSIYDFNSDPWAFLDSEDGCRRQNGNIYQFSNTGDACPPQNGHLDNAMHSSVQQAYPTQNGQLVAQSYNTDQTLQTQNEQTNTIDSVQQAYPTQNGQLVTQSYNTDQTLQTQNGQTNTIDSVQQAYPTQNGQLVTQSYNTDQTLQTPNGQTTTIDMSSSGWSINDFLDHPKVSETPPEELFDLELSSPAVEDETASTSPAVEDETASTTPTISKTQQQMAPRAIIVTGEEENCHVPVSEEHTTLMQSPGGHPVSNSQPSNQYQMQNINGNIIAPLFTLVQPSPPAPMSQQQKGSGVVDVPALTDMEGDYGFNVTIEEKERTTKSPMWLMSKITSKLYTNINKAVPFEIHLKKKVPRDEFRIRAFAVFSSAQFLRTNVVRCPNHASTTDITNHDFPFPGHVVRADHPEAKYEESSNGRLSVVVPLDILQDGSDFTPILLRFMCLGSCVGGINRRPIAIILTLENRSGHVCGRKVIDVRVCACPTRDIRTDEQTLMNKGKRRGSSLQDKTTAPLRKKPKNVEPKVEPDDDDKTFYIPVKGKRLYDFMMMMKKNYYACHPEYAAKYPDDTR